MSGVQPSDLHELFRFLAVGPTPPAGGRYRALGDLGHSEVSDVRIGKVVHLELATDDPDKARKQTLEMCEKLLANPVIEQYTIEILDA